MNIILKIILHLFFWIVFFALSGIVSFQMSEGFDFVSSHPEALIIAAVWAGVAFYSFYFFMYRFVENHQFLKYFLFSVLSVIGISVVFVVFTRMFIFRDKYDIEESWNYTTMAGTYTIANCGSLLRGFIRWIEASGKRVEQEKRNLKLELEALRSQVNPHFLFNTLNNIDALIHTQPHKASAMLITLSDVMRYMLYQTQEETTSVQLETQHIENVLKLQRIRFKEDDYISYSFDLENTELQIAPLLFTPFVENACKYAHYSGKLPVVSVALTQKDQFIRFQCANTFDLNRQKGQEIGGLGLENVRKRLALLYPNNHELNISQDGNLFSVSLSIVFK